MENFTDSINKNFEEQKKKNTCAISIENGISDLITGYANYQHISKGSCFLKSIIKDLENEIADFDSSDSKDEMRFYECIARNSKLAKYILMMFRFNNHCNADGSFQFENRYLISQQKVYFRNSSGIKNEDFFVDYESLVNAFIKDIERYCGSEFTKNTLICTIIARAAALSIVKNKTNKVRLSTIKSPFIKAKINYDEWLSAGDEPEGYQLNKIEVETEDGCWYDMISYCETDYRHEEELMRMVYRLTGLGKENIELD